MNTFARDNNPAELKAFDTTCERLNGFDPGLQFEFVDGFLTALAAGPRVPPVEDWLPALCGDAFERAFADPADHAQALQALRTRLSALQGQLDAETLLDQPDDLHLRPLMAEWTDDDRAALVAAGEVRAEDIGEFLTGAEWASGFMTAVEAFPALWDAPVGDLAAAERETLLACVGALTWREDSDGYRQHLAAFHALAASAPSREALVDAACFAVQDLRMWFVERAPVPETRRVEKTPGRNDPCPCGSGKKYKKCHGA